MQAFRLLFGCCTSKSRPLEGEQEDSLIMKRNKNNLGPIEDMVRDVIIEPGTSDSKGVDSNSEEVDSLTKSTFSPKSEQASKSPKSPRPTISSEFNKNNQISENINKDEKIPADEILDENNKILFEERLIRHDEKGIITFVK